MQVVPRKSNYYNPDADFVHYLFLYIAVGAGAAN